MNKTIRYLVAIIALAVVAISLAAGQAPKKEDDILEIIEENVLTPETTVVPIPDDELIHTVVATDEFWDSDTHWLAMALEQESGVDWPDWAVIMIGDVVMHRVACDECPDTIKGVLLQPGQYEPFFDPFEPFMPDQRYIDLAERILDGETYLTDPSIVYQALFPQGEQTVVTYYDSVLNTTTYFCR